MTVLNDKTMFFLHILVYYIVNLATAPRHIINAWDWIRKRCTCTLAQVTEAVIRGICVGCVEEVAGGQRHVVFCRQHVVIGHPAVDQVRVAAVRAEVLSSRDLNKQT